MREYLGGFVWVRVGVDKVLGGDEWLWWRWWLVVDWRGEGFWGRDGDVEVLLLLVNY